MTALEHSRFQGPRRQWLQSGDDRRDIAIDELTLKREGRRGDDDRTTLQCMGEGRHEIRQRLAGAGPGLHE